jgi:hypothetical protein
MILVLIAMIKVTLKAKPKGVKHQYLYDNVTAQYIHHMEMYNATQDDIDNIHQNIDRALLHMMRHNMVDVFNKRVTSVKEG